MAEVIVLSRMGSQSLNFAFRKRTRTDRVTVTDHLSKLHCWVFSPPGEMVEAKKHVTEMHRCKLKIRKTFDLSRKDQNLLVLK